MKFFVFLLCFIPSISFGLFDEYRSYGENDDPYSRVLFEETLSHFSEGFGMLIYLTTKNYPPAQQMLTLAIQDFGKAKDYLKDYNNRKLRPVQPPSGHSQSLLKQFLTYWFDFDTSAIVKEEQDTFSLSIFFHTSMEHLTEGFYLLDTLKKRGYEPAKEFQNHFEERIGDVMKRFGVPFYLSSEKLDQKCQKIFTNYFTPGK